MQSDQSDPLPVFKRNKKRQKQYKCRYCDTSHHSFKYMKFNHRRSCKQRKVIHQQNEQNLMREEINQQLIEQKLSEVVNPSDHESQKVEPSDLENRLKRLQSEVSKFVDPIRVTQLQKAQQSQQLVDEVVTKVSPIILSNIKINLTLAAEEAYKGGIDINVQRNSLAVNLIQKLGEINYSQMFFNFEEKLKVAHEQLMNLSRHKTARTLSNNNRCYKFLRKYRSFDFEYQATLLSDLLKLGPFQRREIRRYFNMIKEVDHFFAKYPRIPRFQSKIRNVRPTIEMGSITEAIVELFNTNKKILAFDIWFVFCLSLRSSDIFKVKTLKCQYGYAKSIVLTEHKTSKKSVRYLPQSLIFMHQLIAPELPLTQFRFKECRNFCLNKWQSFYALKHSAITSTLTALSKQNPYASFHSSTSTTQKYYLNDKSQQFLDATFSIPIRGVQIPRYKRCEIIDFCSTPFQIQIIKSKEDNFIDLSRSSQIVENQDDDIIMRKCLTEEEIYRNDKLQKQEKLKLVSQTFIFNTFDLQTTTEPTTTLEECLSERFQINQADEILSAVFQKAVQNGSGNDQIGILQAFSEIAETAVRYCNLEYKQKPKVLTLGEMSQNSEVAVCNFEKKYIISSGHQLSIQSINNSLNLSSAIKKTLVQNENFFTNLRIRCSKRRCGYWNSCITLNSKRENVLQCTKCNQTYKETSHGQQTISPSLIEILTNNKRTLNHSHKSLVSTGESNNFEQKLKEDFNATISSESMYDQSLPKSFKTDYCRFSVSLSKQIRYNRKNQCYLGIRIKPSPLGGDGVYATQDIKAGTIILSYIGVIKRNFEVDYKNDSLFSLGWMHGPNKCEVIIEPESKNMNTARYINSSKGAKDANCKISVGILDSQLVIYIFSNKKIPKDHEILYFYSRNYWDNSADQLLQRENAEMDEGYSSFSNSST